MRTLLPLLATLVTADAAAADIASRVEVGSAVAETGRWVGIGGGGLAVVGLGTSLIAGSTAEKQDESAGVKLGAVMLWTGVVSAMLAPPVMLTGDLLVRTALMEHEDFVSTGAWGMWGTGTEAWIGVGLSAAAFVMLPIGLWLERPLLAALSVIPGLTSWVLAEVQRSANDRAWTALSLADGPPATRIPLFSIGATW